MGLRNHFAQQQFSVANGRYGSKADIQGVEPMSAITPQSDRNSDMANGR